MEPIRGRRSHSVTVPVDTHGRVGNENLPLAAGQLVHICQLHAESRPRAAHPVPGVIGRRSWPSVERCVPCGITAHRGEPLTRARVSPAGLQPPRRGNAGAYKIVGLRGGLRWRSRWDGNAGGSSASQASTLRAAARCVGADRRRFVTQAVVMLGRGRRACGSSLVQAGAAAESTSAMRAQVEISRGP